MHRLEILIFSQSLHGVDGLPLTERVERAHSDRARSAITEGEPSTPFSSHYEVHQLLLDVNDLARLFPLKPFH
jgi:hypothetical protein